MALKLLDESGLTYFWGKLKDYFQAKLVSGTNIKTVNNESLLGSGNISISGGGGGEKNVWYATCPTAAATAAKVATTDSEDFTLETGNTVFVKFTNASSYNGTSTLKVDGQTAKNICSVGTTTTTRYYWKAGEVVGFVYDGTNFVMVEKAPATTTYYGITKLSSSTTSTSEALAATPKAVKAAYDLANGKSVVSVTQVETSGTNIATISIDGVTTDLYAPRGGSGAVMGVKGNNESTYRTGTVNLTCANIGAQATLVSGTNIKTINNQSLLGSGNISISGGGGGGSIQAVTFEAYVAEMEYLGVTWYSIDYDIYAEYGAILPLSIRTGVISTQNFVYDAQLIYIPNDVASLMALADDGDYREFTLVYTDVGAHTPL